MQTGVHTKLILANSQIVVLFPFILFPLIVVILFWSYNQPSVRTLPLKNRLLVRLLNLSATAPSENQFFFISVLNAFFLKEAMK